MEFGAQTDLEGDTQGQITINSSEPVVTGSVQVKEELLSKNPSIFPLENETPEFLQREYLISDELYSIGTNRSVKIWRELFKVSGVPHQVGQFFDYFRADMRVRIQILAPTMAYGYVTGWFDPIDNFKSPVYTGDTLNSSAWRTNSAVNGFYLAIADREGYECDLPWPYADPMLPNYETLDPWTLYLKCAHIRMMQDGAVAPVVTVRVYGRFENPRMIGPKFPVIAQSKPNGYKMIEEGAKILGAVAQGIQMSGTSGLWAGLMANAQQMNENDLYVTQREVNQNEENSRTGVKQSMYGDLAGCKSSASFNNLGDHSNTTIPNPKLVADPDPVTDLYQLVRRWAVIEEDEFVNGSSTTRIVLPFEDGPYVSQSGSDTITEAGFLPHVVNMYRYWRGNIDYRIVIFSNALIQARLTTRIYWRREDYQNQDDFDIGSVRSSVNTIQGTTTVDISVPFLRPYYWEGNTETLNAPLIEFSVDTILPLAVGSSPVSLPYIIMKRAGDNFQMSSFTGGVVLGTPVLFDPENNDDYLVGIEKNPGPKTVVLTFHKGAIGSIKLNTGLGTINASTRSTMAVQKIGTSSNPDFDLSFNGVVLALNATGQDIPFQVYNFQVAQTINVLGDLTFEVGPISDTLVVTVTLVEEDEGPIDVNISGVSMTTPFWTSVVNRNLPVTQGKVNGTSLTNVSMGEVPPTIFDFRGSTGQMSLLLKRAQNGDNTLKQIGDTFDNLSEAYYKTFRFVDRLATFFLYWTGSQRWKITIPNDVYYKAIGAVIPVVTQSILPTLTDEQYDHVEIGAMITEQDVWRLLEFEMPFISKLSHANSRGTGEKPLSPLLHTSTVLGTSPLIEKAFWSSGDDFQFQFLVPPSDKLSKVVLQNRAPLAVFAR